jgi:hypothetical protein
MSGSTVSITGSTGITGNTFISGTVKFPSLTNSNGNYLLTYNQGTGQLFYYNTGSISVGTASYVTQLNQNVVITGSLYVSSSADVATLGQFTGNKNGYVEFSIRNTSTGISASGDIAVYADNGTTLNNYIDMGINNSGLNNSYFYGGTDFGDANDAYLYNVGGNLRIGNATSQAPFSQSLFIFSNPSAKPDIAITGSRVGIQKTGSLNAALDVSGSVAITGSLSTNNGNVGINTTASSNWNLDIKDITTVGKLRVGNSDYSDIFTIGIGSATQNYSDLFLNGQSYGLALYANPQSGNGYSVTANSSVGAINYSTASVGLIAGGNSAPLVFGTNGTEKMRVHLTGDVSIGLEANNKTLPGYKLNITGSGTAGVLNANNIMRVSGSHVILPQVSSSLNFPDDTAAAAAGVPLGGLYRNGNVLSIRIS